MALSVGSDRNAIEVVRAGRCSDTLISVAVELTLPSRLLFLPTNAEEIGRTAADDGNDKDHAEQGFEVH